MKHLSICRTYSLHMLQRERSLRSEAIIDRLIVPKTGKKELLQTEPLVLQS